MSDQTNTPRGARMVRLDFNPSGHSAVDKAKQMAAEFIDFLDQRIPLDERSERSRSRARAVSAIEDASMHAVKALTADPVTGEARD